MAILQLLVVFIAVLIQLKHHRIYYLQSWAVLLPSVLGHFHYPLKETSYPVAITPHPFPRGNQPWGTMRKCCDYMPLLHLNMK